MLPYPSGRFGAEFAFVWLWLLVEPARLFLGEAATWQRRGRARMASRTGASACQRMASNTSASAPREPALRSPLASHQTRLGPPRAGGGGTGSKGNKTEQPGPLAFSLLLALPCVAFLVYYLRFQTFV